MLRQRSTQVCGAKYPGWLRLPALTHSGRHEPGADENRSVLCDDGTTKAVVHSDRSHVHALADIVGTPDCNVRRRESNIGATRVVVFKGNGPVRRKADF